jgi:hypothetical protein
MSTQHCGQICDLTLGQAGFPLALALAMVAKPYKNRKKNSKYYFLIDGNVQRKGL